METVFWICVKIMQIISNILGITYQELNVILFVIVHPLITTIFFVLYLKHKRNYIKLYNDKQMQ